MTYASVLNALGDPTRRAILERLREGARAVGEIARDLPVSRPAVSQHLRVLKHAGLVHDRRDGTRRLYELDERGMADLRAYLDGFWETGLAGLKAATEEREGGSMSTQATATAPIRKVVEVNCDPEHAFRVFTERIADWWPLETHSLNGEHTQTVMVEGREGGEVYETSDQGERGHWATVRVWEPPRRLVLAWHVNPEAAAATEIEVTFTADGDRTRVQLEHRNWELLGVEQGAEARAGYNEGWETVLARYAEATGPGAGD